jgi:tetratricopeptide (TPR) repeat protein
MMKLHGTVDDLDTARFAVNQVFSGLDETIEKAFRRVLETRVLIVLGYRGADEFDVNPILFDSRQRSHGITWLVREGKMPEPWVQTYLHNVGGTWLGVNPDNFLNELYDAVGGSEEHQRYDELKQQKGQKDWWKPQLREWGKELHSDNAGAATFLWARILEYLYLYKAAANAYQRAHQYLGDDTKALEALFRQAWMSRQASQSAFETERALQDLQNVATVIETQLKSRPLHIDQAKFQHLLGYVTHQIGITLQALEHFDEAKKILEKAEKIRRQSQDPLLPYTIFQQFINARQASQVGRYEIDDLAPNGWRKRLSGYLKDAASQYKKDGLVADYATTVHNRAFVHQFLAEELEKEGKYDGAELEFQNAWTLYLDAWNYRNRLYDLRYVAQSEVRLAECELGLARKAIQEGDKFMGRFITQHAFERAGIVRELYASIPQQEFRVRDVEKIEEKATRICRECGFKPLRSYLR